MLTHCPLPQVLRGRFMLDTPDYSCRGATTSFRRAARHTSITPKESPGAGETPRASNTVTSVIGGRQLNRLPDPAVSLR